MKVRLCRFRFARQRHPDIAVWTESKQLCMLCIMTDKLSKDAWVSHGFKVLKSHGHEYLKADTMAKSLGVSRGSFYWHFASLREFHRALLQAWREQITETAITGLEQIVDPRQRLSELIRLSFGMPQKIEHAMRRWGGQDKRVYEAVQDVDSRRIAFLTQLICEAGVPPQLAKERATMLAWAFVGRSFAPDFVANLSEMAPRDLSLAFLYQPHQEQP